MIKSQHQKNGSDKITKKIKNSNSDNEKFFKEEKTKF